MLNLVAQGMGGGGGGGETIVTIYQIQLTLPKLNLQKWKIAL